MSARAVPWTPSAQEAAAARRRMWRETGIAYLYLAPAIVLLGLFHFFPAVYALYISTFRWGIVQERFVGLENYQRLLTDERFWNSLGVTVWYVVLCIPAQIALGLGIAYLLFQPIRGRLGYRTAYFLPYITSTVAAALVWRWIYNPDRGLLNGVLSMLGLPTSQWLNEFLRGLRPARRRGRDHPPRLPGRAQRGPGLRRPDVHLALRGLQHRHLHGRPG